MNRYGSAHSPDRRPSTRRPLRTTLTGILAVGAAVYAAVGTAAELRFDAGFPGEVDESAGTIGLGLELVAISEGATGECEVAGDLISTGGSASEGTDYTLGTFNVPVNEQGFAAGDVVGTGTGPITIQDDGEIESDESANLDFAVTSNTCTGDLATVTTTGDVLVINDNDDTAGPSAPASIELSGRAGTTVSSEFEVSDDTPPLSVSTDIGTVEPSVIDGTSGTVTFSFDVPQSAQAGQTFTGTITVSDGSGDGGNTTAIPVSVTAGTDIDTTGLTPTQRSVANAISGACDAVAGLAPEERTSGQTDLLATCDRIQTSATPGALLNEVAQEELFAQGRLADTTARGQLANVKGRLTRVRAGTTGLSLAGLRLAMDGERIPPGLLAAAADGLSGGDTGSAAAFGRWGAYLNGSITRGERDGTSRESGYDADNWSITGGADYRVSNRLVLGGSLGYNRSDTSLDNDSGGIDVDGYTASLYATVFRPEGYYMDAVVSYGRNDYDTNRRVNLGGGGFDAQGDPNGDQLTLSVDGGYDLSRGPWTIGFQGRVVYLDASVDAYDEEASNPGAPGAGTMLHIGEQDIDSFTTELATQVSYAISTNVGVIQPTARLGWEHQFGDDQRDLEAHFLNDPSSSTFRIRSDEPDRNYFNAGAGVSAQFTQGRSAFVFAESVLGREDVSEYTVNAGVRMEF